MWKAMMATSVSDRALKTHYRADGLTSAEIAL